MKHKFSATVVGVSPNTYEDHDSGRWDTNRGLAIDDFRFAVLNTNYMNLAEFTFRPATNEDIPAIRQIIFSVLREYNLKPDENGKDNDLNDIELNYFSNGGYFGVAVDSNSNEMMGTFGLFSKSKDVCEL